MTPHLGTTVLYRSRTGDYTMAAIVIATTRSINPLGVERGQVPPLTGDGHVHLTVFSPGLPGPTTPTHTAAVIDNSRPLGDRFVTVARDQLGEVRDMLSGDQFLGMTQFGSTYAEFDIPSWNPHDLGDDASEFVVAGELSLQPAGTWTPLPRG